MAAAPTSTGLAVNIWLADAIQFLDLPRLGDHYDDATSSWHRGLRITVNGDLTIRPGRGTNCRCGHGDSCLRRDCQIYSGRLCGSGITPATSADFRCIFLGEDDDNNNRPPVYDGMTTLARDIERGVDGYCGLPEYSLVKVRVVDFDAVLGSSEWVVSVEFVSGRGNLISPRPRVETVILSDLLFLNVPPQVPHKTLAWLMGNTSVEIPFPKVQMRYDSEDGRPCNYDAVVDVIMSQGVAPFESDDGNIQRQGQMTRREEWSVTTADQSKDR